MSQNTFRSISFAVLLAVAFVGIANSANAQAPKELAPQLEWPSFPDALDRAAESGKLVLIDIWSPSCGWCRKLQSEIYTQPDLQEFVLSTFELGRLNIDLQADSVAYRGYTLSSQMLSAGLGATGTPTTIFLEPGGGYITRLQGFHAYQDFFDVLHFVGSESFREMSFEDFMQSKKK